MARPSVCMSVCLSVFPSGGRVIMVKRWMHFEVAVTLPSFPLWVPPGLGTLHALCMYLHVNVAMYKGEQGGAAAIPVRSSFRSFVPPAIRAGQLIQRRGGLRTLHAGSGLVKLQTRYDIPYTAVRGGEPNIFCTA